MTPIQCVLDGVDFNDQTNYFLGFGANVGVADLTYSEYVGYDGTVSMYNASDAKLVDVTLPIDIKAADYSTLQTCVAALNSRIAACTWDTPKTLVFDGVSYDIVAGGQVSPTYDELYGVKVARVTVMLKRKPTSTPGGSSGTALNIAGVWVNVMDFGATGNGVTDDTGAIQDALDSLTSGGTLVFPPGTYIVSDTSTIGSDYVTVQGSGAVLKLSDSPDTGGFDDTCRVFDVQDKVGVSFRGLTFLEPASATAYAALSFYSGVIRLHDSTGCLVDSCRFEFDGFATGQTNWLNAVNIDGPSATDNRIEGNYVLGATIRYAWDGSSRNLVIANTVVNAPHNGITGYADATISVAHGYDNQVVGNTVVNAARMGIEDWGSQMHRTRIRGNLVNGSGASLSDGYGISWATSDLLCEGNTVIDFDGYGIEANGPDSRIIGNCVSQKSGGHLGLGEGIILDWQDSDSSHVVSGNVITGCDRGIHAYADFGDVAIVNNRLVDYVETGVKVEPNSAASQAILVEGNSFRLSANSTEWRVGVIPSTQAGAGTANYRIVGNSFVYAAGGTGGSGDLAIQVIEDKTLVMGNYVDGSYGINANGTTPDKPQFIGNTTVGTATIDTTGMTNVVNLGNTT